RPGGKARRGEMRGGGPPIPFEAVRSFNPGSYLAASLCSGCVHSKREDQSGGGEDAGIAELAGFVLSTPAGSRLAGFFHGANRLISGTRSGHDGESVATGQFRLLRHLPSYYERR